ncbi:MAG: hypothetical protein JXA25_12860 [Anaerolineales bacterium]|nr:hypothetical protein [Anaerolineales bacterium]
MSDSSEFSSAEVTRETPKEESRETTESQNVERQAGVREEAERVESVNRATFEPEAAVERQGDYQQAEQVQAALSEVVQAEAARPAVESSTTQTETRDEGESGPSPDVVSEEGVGDPGEDTEVTGGEIDQLQVGSSSSRGDSGGTAAEVLDAQASLSIEEPGDQALESAAESDRPPVESSSGSRDSGGTAVELPDAPTTLSIEDPDSAAAQDLVQMQEVAPDASEIEEVREDSVLPSERPDMSEDIDYSVSVSVGADGQIRGEDTLKDRYTGGEGSVVDDLDITQVSKDGSQGDGMWMTNQGTSVGYMGEHEGEAGLTGAGPAENPLGDMDNLLGGPGMGMGLGDPDGLGIGLGDLLGGPGIGPDTGSINESLRAGAAVGADPRISQAAEQSETGNGSNDLDRDEYSGKVEMEDRVDSNGNQVIDGYEEHRTYEGTLTVHTHHENGVTTQKVKYVDREGNVATETSVEGEPDVDNETTPAADDLNETPNPEGYS